MAQVKSFAKIFFYRMKSCKDDNLQIDFTLNSVNTLKDMIVQIKSNYPDINTTILILTKLLNKKVKIRKFKTFQKKNIKKRNINDEKIEFIKLEGDKFNYTNNYFFSNQNSINDFENNSLNMNVNDNVNNNPSNFNNYNGFNINFIGNNIINNNIIVPKKILNNLFVNLENILNVENMLLNHYLELTLVNDTQKILVNNLIVNNIEKILLSDNILNLKNILLNQYWKLNILNVPFVYLPQINYLFFFELEILNSIDSIYNAFIFNVLNELNSFTGNPPLNNSFSFINNNNNSQNNMKDLINPYNQINLTKFNNN